VDIWCLVASTERGTGIYEAFTNNAKAEYHREQLERLSRAQTSGTLGGSRIKLKVPMPSKYDGTKGDPAFTLMVGCGNYCTMDPMAFSMELIFIRWALQQMEEKQVNGQ
jgi:hypothetical protein